MKLFLTDILNFWSHDDWPSAAQTSDHHSIPDHLKLRVAIIFSVAINWQLNAAPYLCGVHKPCPLLRLETMPCSASGQLVIPLVTSLGTRLLVRVRTKLQNGVFCSGQQPQCCKWLLLSRVKLKLWRRWLVVEFHVVTRISFVLKWRVLKPFARHRCWTSWS